MRQGFSTLIIGCGAIAGGYDEGDIAGPDVQTHAKAFQLHEGFDLSGCIDRDHARAEEFARIWQVGQVYESLDQALADRDFDVISVCTSTPGHEKILRKLHSTNPRLVFCEKPLTDRIASARDMAALYQGRLAVNYLRRFDPHIRRLARQISDGEYGDFLSAKACYNKGLYNNGSHMTDLIQMLTGPLKVTAAGVITRDFWPDDPTISAHLESRNGAPVELIGSDVRHGMVFDLDLVFECARISLTDFSNRITIRIKDRGEQSFTCDLNRGMLNALSNIHDHLITGAALFSTGENALSALGICADIRKMSGLEG